MSPVGEEDLRVLMLLDRSGGRPEWDRRVSAAVGMSGQRIGHFVELIDGADQEVTVRVATSAVPFSPASFITVFARWFAYRVLFRGGWTVHIDAPGRDPIKIRCRDHTAALSAARQLASRIEKDGLAILDSAL